ncbi:MAG: CDP-alcohol phosphatidyltransferase family protein, partial [Clostridiales bacterium]|nr:CDP-alcohol phosphatidyltransferase family protein [Clostridiales bacterium]
MFKKENLTVPNFLSLSRVIFIPLLLYFVHNEMRLAFMIAYLVIASTDFFDGQIARRFNQKSEIGKEMDSYCDLIFYLSTAYYIYKLYPQQIIPNLPLLYVLIGVIVLSLIISFIKIKKPVMMHTWMLKLPSGLCFLYVLFSYFYDTPIALTIVLAVYMLGFI